MLSCPAKRISGIDCPGCGMQRSAIAALRGDWSASWDAYPPLALAVLVALLTIGHLLFKWRQGARIVQWTFILTAAAVAVNYIYKAVTGQLV
jgi:hypothetical protein